MNIWTQKSIDLASQGNYLDLLYKVYPMSINLRRELSDELKHSITQAYENRQPQELLRILLKQEVFPLKDSYVAFLKKDIGAIDRNPVTVERISGMLYEMGLVEILDKTTVPKETNRQIGPLFKRWLDAGSLGVAIYRDEDLFVKSNENAILNSSDAAMQAFAKKYLGYDHEKGLDFIARFNDKYIIGEAKFLSDFGGHQNAQYNDAISTMLTPLRAIDGLQVIKIAILDGVVYIKSGNKMYKSLTTNYSEDQVIISSVLLRDYLFSL